ncbi:NADH dehydrogenase [Robiginitalea myxolifaciens]|uniref:NADH:ubiquinone reductase (non-electrogenic) n=1 Tax=Robiginitalea myxolifaciens TaxID=400055 RepID=A0A1I6FN15_9FLAO|nr:NAD(P)/FAD-dependent oxidoreductase [Robiginitalea myxolifaciens]SFR31342.1 NADH dehydrogenase [Robiginitalea myxolifaciens]
MDKERKKVVIVGGGFAGINLALALSKVKYYEVVLVDKNNYNHFAPLLYQVATGMLQVSSISLPFRTLFKNKKHLRFRIGTLKKIDCEARILHLNNGKITYDLLVLATGTVTNFFGNENIQNEAWPMKSVEDAVKLRNALLRNAEKASITQDPEKLEVLRNIVIAGGGPAGVEVAGMLAELRNRALRKLYPDLDASRLQIYLVEGSPNLLGGMRTASQEYAMESMKKLGIKVIPDVMVEDYREETVYLSNGQEIRSKTLIWTTGVRAQHFEGIPEELYDKSFRIRVNQYNQIDSLPEIFVIGDASLQEHEGFDDGYPQLGSVATQHGKTLAKNLIRLAKGRAMEPFEYFDKGTMAIIGKSKATADLEIPKKTLTGWFAWAAWLTVHLFLLINYRNRIKTMWEWTNSYLTTTEPEGLLLNPENDKV